MSRLLYIAFNGEDCLGAFVSEERAAAAVEKDCGVEGGQWIPPISEDPDNGKWEIVDTGVTEMVVGRVESVALDRRFADRDRRRP